MTRCETSRLMSASEGTLHRTVYQFGSLATGMYGQLTLRPDGLIGQYTHPNEHSYQMISGSLRLISADGTRSKEFREIETNTFLSDDIHQHYLVPLVTLDPHVPTVALPSVVVNSIPKAGTYLGELLFETLGFTSLKLHLAAYKFHDNRRIPESEIHASPHEREVSCSASAITSLMQPGEIALGHIEAFEQIEAIARQGCIVASFVRDLRDVLISLYRFKLMTVRPLDATDQWWREVSEPGRFLVFLSYHLDKDIPFIKEIARCILLSHSQLPQTLLLRFEEFGFGTVGDIARERLFASFGDSTAERLIQALPKVVGQRTATLTDKRSSHEQYWNADVQAFFEASGLSALNFELGYSP